MHIGKQKICSMIKKSWLKDEVRLLGIKVCKNEKDMFEKNYEDKLENIEARLQAWSNRNLSLIGRIHIIKSLASSQLIYQWSIIQSPPESFFNELETKLYNFLWNSPVERIKRATIIAPYEEGGLKMIDSRIQEQELKIKWIGVLIEENTKLNKNIWFDWVVNNIPPVDLVY